MPADVFELPGFRQAPNIHRDPDTYEIENRAADPEGRLEAAMWGIAHWEGKVVLDLGCGTGFHLPRFHERAAHVVGMEPDDRLRLRAMARVVELGLEHVSVVTGSAERVLLPDRSVDVVHARFAYFFGPGCEAGLRELERVVRPGGTAFVIDNDLRSGEFASWLRRVTAFAKLDSDEIESFWKRQGFELTRVESEWRFESRGDLEAVVRLELPADVAEGILKEHEGLRVGYRYCLYHRNYRG